MLLSKRFPSIYLRWIISLPPNCSIANTTVSHFVLLKANIILRPTSTLSLSKKGNRCNLQSFLDSESKRNNIHISWRWLEAALHTRVWQVDKNSDETFGTVTSQKQPKQIDVIKYRMSKFACACCENKYIVMETPKIFQSKLPKNKLKLTLTKLHLRTLTIWQPHA